MVRDVDVDHGPGADDFTAWSKEGYHIVDAGPSRGACDSPALIFATNPGRVVADVTVTVCADHPFSLSWSFPPLRALFWPEVGTF